MDTLEGMVPCYRDYYRVSAARFFFVLGAVLYILAAFPGISFASLEFKIHTSAMSIYIVYGGYLAISLKPSMFITYVPRIQIPVEDWRVKPLPLLASYPEKTGAAGYVYLIQEWNEGYFKIGRTACPDDRRRTFNVNLPFQVEYLCMIETDDMYALEKKLHRHFWRKRVRRTEWFKLSGEEAASIMALAQNG